MIFISTAEISADFHASYLIKIIQKQYKYLNIYALGSTHLKKIGVKIIADISIFSTIGIIESIFSFFKIFWQIRKTIKFIKKKKIKLLILVDAPGINLYLLKIAWKLNIKIIYYFPPHVSIWAEWNIKKIASKTNYIITPFKKDAKIYENAGAKVIHCRYPILDYITQNFLKKEKKKESKKFIIGLFPGSRKQEIKKLLPIILKSINQLKQIRKNDNLNKKIIFYLACANKKYLSYILKMIHNYSNIKIKIINQSDYKKYKQCNLAIACSGSVTLELALLKIPTIVLYKLNLISYLIAKKIVKTKWISLANILLNESLFVELIQKNCTQKKLLSELNKLLNNINKINLMKNKLEKLFNLLNKEIPLNNLIHKIDSLIN